MKFAAFKKDFDQDESSPASAVEECAAIGLSKGLDNCLKDSISSLRPPEEFLVTSVGWMLASMVFSKVSFSALGKGINSRDLQT